MLRTTAKCLPKDQQPRDLQTWSEILGMLPQATIFSALNSNADCISMPILKKIKEGILGTKSFKINPFDQPPKIVIQMMF